MSRSVGEKRVEVASLESSPGCQVKGRGDGGRKGQAMEEKGEAQPIGAQMVEEARKGRHGGGVGQLARARLRQQAHADSPSSMPRRVRDARAGQHNLFGGSPKPRIAVHL